MMGDYISFSDFPRGPSVLPSLGVRELGAGSRRLQNDWDRILASKTML
jgi:hypothetical protein